MMLLLHVTSRCAEGMQAQRRPGLGQVQAEGPGKLPCDADARLQAHPCPRTTATERRYTTPYSEGVGLFTRQKIVPTPEAKSSSMLGSMLLHLLCHASRYGSLGGRHATLRQLASAAPTSLLVQQYAALVSSGSLLHDASQEAAVQALATLQQHMLAPSPLNLTNQQEMLRPPRGVVLHGPVGSESNMACPALGRRS